MTKSKNEFDNEEMPLGYCTKCGDGLNDHKRKTAWKHDMKYHAGYFTAQTGIEEKDFPSVFDSE